MYEITITSLSSQFSVIKTFSRTLNGALGLAAYWLECNDN